MIKDGVEAVRHGWDGFILRIQQGNGELWLNTLSFDFYFRRAASLGRVIVHSD